MDGEKTRELADLRKQPLAEQALNLLDLKMDANGKNSASKDDIKNWQNQAGTQQERQLLGYALNHFDEIRNQDQTDNGGLPVVGWFEGNASDITKSDTQTLKTRLDDLRATALSPSEIAILRKLGPNVDDAKLASARVGAPDGDVQNLYDDLRRNFNSISTLADDGDTFTITSQDVNAAEQRTNELTYWNKP